MISAGGWKKSASGSNSRGGRWCRPGSADGEQRADQAAAREQRADQAAARERRQRRWAIRAAGTGLLAAVVPAGGCSPGAAKRDADRVAGRIIEEKQKQALGRTEPLTIERPADTLRRRLLLDQHLPVAGPSSFGPEHLPRIKKLPESVAAGEPVPEAATGPATTRAVEPLRLSLVEALEVGAHNSRDYQARKESIFTQALRLDLERDAFRTTFTGLITGQIESDTAGTDVTGAVVSPNVGFTQRLANGAVLTGRIGLDFARLLSGNRSSSRGVFADASITMPLLRGAGVEIVTEPLKQAERDVIYAIWDFEEFKRNFAVQVASGYLNVLQNWDQVRNAEDNYKRLVTSTRRARRMADAGKLPDVQVDQSVQDELRARSRWITAQTSYRRRIDAFKMLLGLPPDAEVELDRSELDRLTAAVEATLPMAEATTQGTTQETVPPADAPVTLAPPEFGTGPQELADEPAIRTALENRLDLRALQGRVYDAQRQVVVSADALGAGLNVGADASLGSRRGALSGASGDANLRLGEGRYGGSATLDLPLERTRERNAYRVSLIDLERAARDVQDQEDQIKLDVMNTLRDLLVAREELRIQARAVRVAQRRVDSTDLQLEAGRVVIRDVLDAQEALVTARNAFTASVIGYRTSEWRVQQILGVLEVNENGLWRELQPQKGPG